MYPHLILIHANAIIVIQNSMMYFHINARMDDTKQAYQYQILIYLSDRKFPNIHNPIL